LIRYLLDTNIISDVIKNPHGRARQRIEEVGRAQVCTSIIVAAELRYGVAWKGSPQLADRVDNALKRIQTLSFEPPADAVYGELRARLEAAGQVISANDMLIAAQAVTLDLTLVTDNLREFGRVDGLQVENWLRDG